MPLSPGDIIDRYEVQDLVAQGGMSSVYLVRHLALESYHALKVLNADLVERDEIRERFLAEGRIHAQLRHPNIVLVTDLVAEQGVAGLVMEFVDGPSLDTFLEGLDRRPSLREVLDILLPILEAVGFAHARGVIHRDLKPSNLLLARDARDRIRPVVVDFGIAKIREDAQLRHSKRSATRSGARMGTLNYMSPEQVHGDLELDQRTDIFSMGAILYEMITGRPAFVGSSDFETMQRIVDGRVVFSDDEVESLPGSLLALVRRALAVDPAQRFPTCAAMAEAAESLGVLADAPSPARHPVGRGLGFVILPPGTFVMGSPPDEPDRDLDEIQHGVTLSRAFHLARSAVSVGLWTEVQGSAPEGCDARDPRLPVHNVSWMEAIRFCNRFSRLQGYRPAYELLPGDRVGWDVTASGFRLPTEAEWEYAARAGTIDATHRPIADFAWYKGNSHGVLQPVARLSPNAWGLHDMIGNAWEWVWDWYAPFASLPLIDPPGPIWATQRVFRGGSYTSEASMLRFAVRNGLPPETRNPKVGFRLARFA